MITPSFAFALLESSGAAAYMRALSDAFVLPESFKLSAYLRVITPSFAFALLESSGVAAYMKALSDAFVLPESSKPSAYLR